MPLSGREKATIFLSILGAETSARVLRYLPDELADLIASGINHLPSPSPEGLDEVINDFKSYVALPGPRQAPPPQIEAKPTPPARPKKIYNVLMYERPQMRAFLLSLLPPEQQEEGLQSLSRDKATLEELIGTMKKNPLRAKIEVKLKEQFREKLFAQ